MVGRTIDGFSIDPDWEFKAPMFYDFTNPHENSEGEFSSLPEHPSSLNDYNGIDDSVKNDNIHNDENVDTNEITKFSTPNNKNSHHLLNLENNGSNGKRITTPRSTINSKVARMPSTVTKRSNSVNNSPFSFHSPISNKDQKNRNSVINSRNSIKEDLKNETFNENILQINDQYQHSFHSSSPHHRENSPLPSFIEQEKNFFPHCNIENNSKKKIDLNTKKTLARLTQRPVLKTAKSIKPLTIPQEFNFSTRLDRLYISKSKKEEAHEQEIRKNQENKKQIENDKKSKEMGKSTFNHVRATIPKSPILMTKNRIFHPPSHSLNISKENETFNERKIKNENGENSNLKMKKFEKSKNLLNRPNSSFIPASASGSSLSSISSISPIIQDKENKKKHSNDIKNEKFKSTKEKACSMIPNVTIAKPFTFQTSLREIEYQRKKKNFQSRESQIENEKKKTNSNEIHSIKKVFKSSNSSLDPLPPSHSSISHNEPTIKRMVTNSVPIKLCLEDRIAKRKEFDNAIKNKQKAEEEVYQKYLEDLKVREEIQIRELKRKLVHQPLMVPKYPPQDQFSLSIQSIRRPVTKPSSPKLLTACRRKRKRSISFNDEIE